MTTRLLSYRIHEAEEPAIVPPMTTTSPPSTNSPPMMNLNSPPMTNSPPTADQCRSISSNGKKETKPKMRT
ncbi:hypothetical protein F8M41_008298 [Gigaspora margarita]|uniref:Uncharacterized protein n=1 Tax=Gigaspora margarita TaxID=4874 RepID=A0A8H3X6B9_GIGMA|nr:hypothetical protein F8M41_008298 [Gigaspora margarita]